MSDDDVVGRRIGAALVDTLAVFALVYAGILWFGARAGIAAVAGLSAPVVVGFLLWYVFAVMGFAPLLFMHGYSPRWFVLGVGAWVVYGAVFETVWGRTPGKRLFGLAVTAADGSAPAPRRALARNVLRYLDGLGFYFLGFLVLAVTSRHQRLGDLVGGTVVVSSDECGVVEHLGGMAARLSGRATRNESGAE